MKEFFNIETPYSSEDYKIMDVVCKNRADFPLSQFTKSPYFPNKFRWNIHNSELPILYDKLEKMYDSTGNDDVLSWLEDIQKVATTYDPGPKEPEKQDFHMNETAPEDNEIENIDSIFEDNLEANYTLGEEASPQKDAVQRFIDLITNENQMEESEIDESGSENLANMHGTNLKPSNLVDEVTDTERYEDVVFMQGHEASEALEILKTFGRDAALEHLKQWHYPGEGMGSNEESHGDSDKTYRKDGYIMSWNPYIETIGLQYDTENDSINEDSMMLRKLAGQRGKKSPLGKHGPRSQNAK